MIPVPAQLLQVLAASPRDLLDRVVVWESKTVPGTFGLYARRLLRKGSYLGVYTGCVFPTLRKLLSRNPYTMYALERTVSARREFVDGDYMLYPDKASILSLVNGTSTAHRANALITASGKIVVKAAIPPGQEILLCYGNEYFKECLAAKEKIKHLSKARRTLTPEELRAASEWTEARSSSAGQGEGATSSMQAEGVESGLFDDERAAADAARPETSAPQQVDRAQGDAASS